MKPESDFNKQIDLDPSEYRKDGQREPAFGPGAMPLLLTLLLGFPVAFLVVWGFSEVQAILWPPVLPWWAPLPQG